MADIQDEIVELERRIGRMEAELREAYEDVEDSRRELREGCTHPIEFRKRHFIPRDEPGAADTEYYTCNICGQRFDKESEGLFHKFDPGLA